MKVQCDVCAAEAASVFCCADEAALCDACDRRVHSANKLAGKHRRFSLLQPLASSSSAQKPPLCDICQVCTRREAAALFPRVASVACCNSEACGLSSLQEKRGFLFCKEDRAILCRECDIAVHTTSELTRRHGRFLLTGVRLSSAPMDSPAPSEEEEEEEAGEDYSCSPSSVAGTAAGSASDGSSISEYLTKTLPGWHVEDFLVDEATAAAAAASSSSDGLFQGGLLAQIGGMPDGYAAWAGREQLHSGVAVAADERASRERWVPQMNAEWGAGSKRPRASPPCLYW
ncbi:B-box zinc finger protein 20-like isoform X1 [Oryza glaberrima]|uniref:B-box zinc finger protein 20-like isoform X1 n=1 Tax=Oryza glaberrima TaxID=4538 RepID=UPI00224C3401|nr:B-box zinc finger protein 20-like isoform X1 [Oryza glaberrima]